MAIQPLRKSTFHERAERKEAQRVEKLRATRMRKSVERLLREHNRALAYDRDGGKCRATGKWLPFRHSSLLQVAHSHHVIFLSRGGSDGPENRITVCFAIHKMIHHGLLDVTGDPNSTVTFTEKNLETGAIVRVWDSAV